MKLKGAVKFFAIALSIVCLFQLSFTFIANRLDSSAERYANGKVDKKRHYIDSISRQTVFSIPLIRKYNYLDIKERELNLGLDLRGGMHVTLEVELNKLLRELSDNDDNVTFNKALAKATVQQVTSQRNFIDIFYDDIKEINPNFKLSSVFAKEKNSENVKFGTSNEDVIKFLKEQSNSAIERTYNILRSRIDKFGVTQPNIQLDENAGRIMVELPGVDDEVRVRKLLQASAKLEFYETYSLNFLSSKGYLKDADDAYYRALKAEKVVSEDSTTKNLLAGGGSDSTKKDSTSDTGKLAGGKKNVSKKDSSDQPLIRALFVTNPGDGTSPVMGIVRVADTAKVNRILARPEVKDKFPSDLIMMWSIPVKESEIINLIALKASSGEEPAVLTGEVVTDARQDVNPQSQSYVVSMRMNPEGADKWAAITKRNIGNAVAIVLDGNVQSYPRVNGEIPNGSSEISGSFTANEAKDLANVLKAGKLPVSVKIIEEAAVGASLGQEAISKGLLSLLVGLICIVVFMILYYNRSGWVANFALIINLFFIVGVLASLGAALTLPGMAGIVLTLAMAVDANVLIYERVRDEMLLGKNLRMAIAEGFKHAMSSIIDANICTLLIGIILLSFGSGPIYGFAVVLVIGILTSLFTAILITRLIFDWMLEKDKTVNFGNAKTMNLFRHFDYDFVGKRKIFYGISGTIIVIGIVSMFVQGLNYGVDFKGGYDYVVSFDKSVEASNIQSILTPAFKNSAPEVKSYGSDNKLNIVTDFMVNSTSDSAADIVSKTMVSALTAKGYKVTIESSQKVGSTVASDIKNSAFNSIFFSLFVIFIYIVIRFKRWQFALGATVALAHDIFFVITIFSIFKDIMPFSLNVDQAIVAALLTIAGYSMNDTVVVFDRIREYLNNNKKGELEHTINDAINKTLSRTLITSFTIFIVVLILFIFGGQVIKGFSFALLIGILIGTYSSIFVATPIVIDFNRKKKTIEL